MSCDNEIFVGDTGTSIEFLIKECDSTDPANVVESLVDVSSATSFDLKFIKPDGTSLSKANPDVWFLTDGTDSLIRYITIETDLDQAGTWKAQLRITLPLGKWYGSTVKFKVRQVL